MLFYLIAIVIAAAALLQARQTSLTRRILHILCTSCLLLAVTYVFFRKVFAVSSIQDIAITSVSRLYMFAIWSSLLILGCAVVRVLCTGKKRISITRRQEAVIKLLGTAFLIFFGTVFSLNQYVQHQIRITEICTDEVVLADGSAKKEYVELYNPTYLTVQLTGCAITDDPGNTARHYSLPQVVVPARGYAVAELAEDCPFSIRSSGEDIYLLSSGSGQIIDQVLAEDLPEPDTYLNWVYGKRQDTGAWEIQYASPLLENTADKGKNPIQPQFSADSGFYEEAFGLTLSAPEGYKIYYTLDGSVPDESTLLYTGPIDIVNRTHTPNIYLAAPNIVTDGENSDHNSQNVDKAFIVRAVTVDGTGRRSEPVSKTFYVGLEQYHSDVVLSIITDYDYLIGEDGICVTGSAFEEWLQNGAVGEAPSINYFLHGREWEVPANIELLSDNKPLLNCMAGLRVQGGYARTDPLKRLRLISRDCYSGSRYFDFDLFDIPNHSFFARQGFADVLGHQLMLHSDIAGMDAVAAHVFVNGEYWYDYYLRERYDENWVSSKFGVNQDDVLLYEVMPEEIVDYYTAHDLSTPEAYSAFGEFVDIQNFITYSAANIYLNNADVSQEKNLRIWKTAASSGHGYRDGKFRFLLYDLDYLSSNDTDYLQMNHYEANTFTLKFPHADNPYLEGNLFWAMKQNEQFRRDFVLTFMDMVNTCFEKETVAKYLEDWGFDRTWNYGFFDKRAQYIVPHMAQEFGLSGTLETLGLSANLPEAGTIQINTVAVDPSAGDWSGQYYTDYPVTISAQPKEGYAFVGWSHQGMLYQEETQQITLGSGENLWQAQFVQTGPQA